MMNKYTKDSKRLLAWLECEQDASNQYNPDINFYKNFFRNREGRAQNLIGNNRTVQFSIVTKNGQNFTTSSSSESLSGNASIQLFDVRIEDHPEVHTSWSGITSRRMN